MPRGDNDDDDEDDGAGTNDICHRLLIVRFSVIVLMLIPIMGRGFNKEEVRDSSSSVDNRTIQHIQ